LGVWGLYVGYRNDVWATTLGDFKSETTDTPGEGPDRCEGAAVAGTGTGTVVETTVINDG